MSKALTYWDPTSPGISRARRGKGFTYKWPSGKSVAAATRARIERLVIPPAWTNVTICPDSYGHIQAVGRDAKHRLQYRYHDKFREAQEAKKFGRLVSFAEKLPEIRAAIAADMRLPELTRRHVLAAVVYLLEATLIRIGNTAYAQNNNTYGLTTLLNNHVIDHGGAIKLKFRGKSGKEWTATLTEKRIVRLIRKCQSLPGELIFQYYDENGELRRVLSNDINDYLREISGKRLTAKDFRTWAGSTLFFETLADAAPAENKSQRKKMINVAVKRVAQALGNTVAVSRRAYIHPAIEQAYIDKPLPYRRADLTEPYSLTPAERGLLRLLRSQRTARTKRKLQEAQIMQSDRKVRPSFRFRPKNGSMEVEPRLGG